MSIESRNNEQTLRERLDWAAEDVTVGAEYAHYKDPSSMIYKVAQLAIDEATQKVMVVYQAQYGENLTWSRPFNSFVEDVKHEGKMVPRFRLIEN